MEVDSATRAGARHSCGCSATRLEDLTGKRYKAPLWQDLTANCRVDVSHCSGTCSVNYRAQAAPGATLRVPEQKNHVMVSDQWLLTNVSLVNCAPELLQQSPMQLALFIAQIVRRLNPVPLHPNMRFVNDHHGDVSGDLPAR